MRRLPILLVLMATACFVSPERLEELRGDQAVDADGDGISADVDCDDQNEEVGDSITFHEDADGDGIGNANGATTEACEAPDGFAAAAGDCDDQDGDRFPGNPELADDGTDQDCNGADSVTCFADADHDGWGSTTTVLAADGTCDAADGEADDDDDCADADATRFPGASEIVGDTIDQNCDGFDTPPCYHDDDGDSFGDPLDAIGTEDCAGAGGVTVGTDCNDSDDTVHPGAAELCDGQANACGSLPPNETDADDDGSVGCAIDADGWDGDSGVTSGGDCDPSNGATYPGAVEICDGRVNLCGGSLPANETDGDDDGYVGCTFASGVTSGNWGHAETPAVLGGGDCNPSNGATHPGASEICDGEINTCGGELPSEEIDADDDGYVPCAFVPGITASNWGHAETPPVVGDADCDDEDSALSPGMAELCDEVDQNCDSVPDDGDTGGGYDCAFIVVRPVAPLSTATVTSQTPTLHWTVEAPADGARIEICADRACSDVEYEIDADGTSAAPPEALTAGAHYWRLWARAGDAEAVDPSPTWEFFVGHRSAPRDTSHGSIPDYNGDGYADLAVGEGDFGVGRVHVYYGASDGLPVSPNRTLVAPGGTSSQFGLSPLAIANAGDVNGDGFADLVVGAINTAGVGSAYVYMASPAGIPSDPSLTLVRPSTATGYFGTVGYVGDVNGDGFADLVIGTQQGTDQAFFYPGGPDGPGTEPTATLQGPASSGAYFGWYFVGDDVTGDGLSDVIITAPATSATAKLCIYEGTQASPGVATTASRTILHPYPGTGWLSHSYAPSLGDFTGDGRLDLAAHGPSVANQQSLYVYYADEVGLPDTLDASLTSGNPATSCCFATATENVGDVNGDGYDDLWASNYAYPDSGANREGEAYLYYGGPSGVASSPDVTFANPNHLANAYFGIAGGGADFDGDGYSDIAVASHTKGKVYVYPGGPDGPADPLVLTDPDGGGGLFGYGLAP